MMADYRLRAMSWAAVTLLSTAMLAVASPDDAKKRDPEAIGARKVDGGINFYSVEKEISLGKQLAIEVERQAKLLEDPIITEYINRLTQNLARNSDVKFPVTVKVLDDDVINAFTLPGGYLFLNTGLIRLSESESELASAISHELGHVAARHAVRQATRTDLLQASTIPLIFLGGIPGAITRELAGIGLPVGMFKFSRDFENEADILGTQYLYKSGYDPNAAIDMFERIEATEQKRPGAVSQLFNTHPRTSDRIMKAQQNIDQHLHGRDEYIVNTSEYEDMRARLIGIQQAKKAAKPAPSLYVKPGENGTDEHPTLKREE
jgi:predicted Zn-dependent protease